MKKNRLISAVALALTALIITAAAAGDAADPLISLSYLTGAYRDTVNAAVEERLDTSDQTLTDKTAAKLAAIGATGDMERTDVWKETRLKSGDVLYGPSGLCVLILAGDVQVTFDSGAVVDITTGKTVESGSALSVDHRYMVAEDTAALFTVTSATAVVNYMGYYGFSYSGAIDYNAMAAALKTMHLFRGSFTAFGSGFDLELTPTRLQALIMFIRVLGEEEAALAYTGTTPFDDIAPGTDAARYVGYAYEKGYTNGYTAKLWKPANTVNVYQYTEFILRALGYSSAANTNLADTLERAQTAGVMTPTEAAAMKNVTFLRAHLVYLSYYAMDVPVAETGVPLREVLIGKGVFTWDEAAAAQALVTAPRIY